jgi:hypothetical protein
MDDEVLTGYLQNHWAGATAGVALFRRVARTHGDPAVAVAVGALADEIAEDREALRRIMEAVGTRPSVVGTVTARVGAELGRLKPNGRLLTRSPLTDVLEVEALRDAVFGKRGGWELLRVVAEEDGRLDAMLIEELMDRADDQLERLRRLHREISRKRVAV